MGELCCGRQKVKRKTSEKKGRDVEEDMKIMKNEDRRSEIKKIIKKAHLRLCCRGMDNDMEK